MITTIIFKKKKAKMSPTHHLTSTKPQKGYHDPVPLTIRILNYKLTHHTSAQDIVF